MRDYSFERCSGEILAISRMTNVELEGCLSNGINSVLGIPPNNIMERLRIERTIRELGLRPQL
jgi:hypothetical protein